MNTYKYPSKKLVPDYLRAGFGFFVPAGLIVFTDLVPLIFYILVGMAFLFGVYGLRTVLLQATVLTVDSDAIRQEGPLGPLFDRRLLWTDLRDIRLRYFSTRRDRKQGWMQLILRATANGASRGNIRLDSNLMGFEEIVRRAYDVSVSRELPIDPTSASNLAAMDLGDGEPRDCPRDVAMTP